MSETENTAARLAELGTGVGLLWAIEVDSDDPDQAETVSNIYAMAEALISLIADTPARELTGIRIKAEAVAWCCASRTDFALGDTSEARLIGSLLRDLLAG